MKITKIEISNFRSIEEIEFDFNDLKSDKAFVLLWINEAWKSNILKAIGLLDKDILNKVEYLKDCNKFAQNKGDNITVKYELEIGGITYYRKKLIDKWMPKDLADAIDITKMQRLISIDKSNTKSDYYLIRIKDNGIFSDYVIHSWKISLLKDVYTWTDVVDSDNISTLVWPGYNLLDKTSIEEYLQKELKDNLNTLTPNVIFWKYSDEYLINKEIDLNAFRTDNGLSIPLKNIFDVAGIEDISTTLDLVATSKEKKKQLENTLTEKITDHINNLWQEHEINIVIDIDNMICEIMIEDKDNTSPKYSMDQRSDWFKQFISILLNLSARYSSEKLKNNIILLDEPEIHLHPSWIKYLRDELLKISKDNIVIISTHSIYMVDRSNLSRHYKVEKQETLTTMTRIPEDNPYMEEVIYESLWTSIYEIIEPNMIVFEGKTDKDIFDAFLRKYKIDLKPKDLATISADGVEKIPNYIKFFNWKYVKWYVIVDSDSAWIAIKKKIIIDNKNTYEINDIYKTLKKSTLEDLLPKDLIEKIILDNYSVTIDLDVDKPFIYQLEQYNKKHKGIIHIDNLKWIIVNSVIKDISKLNKVDCKKKYDIYYSFLETFIKKVK